MATAGQKRKRTSPENIPPTPHPTHPYLTGNFAPIHRTLPLTPCAHSGSIPPELAGGEYVRNGSNPVSNGDLARDAHWFDGDGMLSGVSFVRDETTGDITPEFVNRFVLTDLYLNALSSPALRVPILPSIATLVNPVASFLWVTLRILRTVLLVVLSHLPGSKQPIRKISVANTNVVYHDGRAMALCESGPPIRVQLPGLETVGWFDGNRAEGEPPKEMVRDEKVLGEEGGVLRFMREWTTAHPKVDPHTKEMILFHSCFAPPYVQYSLLPRSAIESPGKILNAPVPGVSSAKMMHDFGVSSTRTVIMDLPLSLDPVNLLRGLPPVAYDSSRSSRFGVFPRRDPSQVRWFETDACCIFHTANTWDDLDAPHAVNMLACRLTSATLVFAAGNIAPPVEKKKAVAITAKRMPFFSRYDPDIDDLFRERTAGLETPREEKEALIPITSADAEVGRDDDPFDEDQCRLYYYQFDLRSDEISSQWALTAIPFEFPSVRPELEMHAARYVYGCTTTTTAFGSALGKATKIDAVVKIDAATLIARGKSRPPRSVTGVVDGRTISQVLHSRDPHDPIRVFRMPAGWYAQEPRFVPAASDRAEDDGYLLFYAFDESQLRPTGAVPADSSPRRARSELWILDASTMRHLVARVYLPQRVPYGLHGSWFSADQIRAQRPVDSVRSTANARAKRDDGWWMAVRDRVERFLQ